MAMLDCRDVLDAVFAQVKDTYVLHFYSSKVKSTTSSENASVDEELKMTAFDDPKSENNVNSKESTGSSTETVKETLEFVTDSKTLTNIRYEIEEKFPYALATVCSNLAKLDRMYRQMKNYGEQPSFSEFCLEVGDDFPLCERFVFPCVMFVSSMVLIDIDEKKSDAFYDKYAISLTQIVSEMPYECASTVEKYPY